VFPLPPPKKTGESIGRICTSAFSVEDFYHEMTTQRWRKRLCRASVEEVGDCCFVENPLKLKEFIYLTFPKEKMNSKISL